MICIYILLFTYAFMMYEFIQMQQNSHSIQTATHVEFVNQEHEINHCHYKHWFWYLFQFESSVLCYYDFFYLFFIFIALLLKYPIDYSLEILFDFKYFMIGSNGHLLFQNLLKQVVCKGIFPV